MSFAQGFAPMLCIAHLQSLRSFRQTPGFSSLPLNTKNDCICSRVIFWCPGGLEPALPIQLIYPPKLGAFHKA
jgi:hypothetical protein